MVDPLFKCIFLGSGASLHTADRQHVNLLFKTNETSVMIDANGDSVRRLWMSDISHLDLHHMILTHYYVDHILGAVDVLFQRYVMSFGNDDIQPLNIYGTEKTLSVLENMISALDSDYSAFYTLHEIPHEQYKFVIDDLQFNTFPVDHGDMPTIGMRAQSVLIDRGFVYSADTTPCPNVFNAIQPNDILIHECLDHNLDEHPMHTTLKQLTDVVPQLNVSKVYLVHMYPDMQANEDSIQKELDKTFNGQIVFAHDMEHVSV